MTSDVADGGPRPDGDRPDPGAGIPSPAAVPDSLPEFNLDPADIRLDDGETLKIIHRRPQIPYPLHTHSLAELVIITSGTGHHRVGGQLLPIAAGDVFVIQGDRAHGYEDLDDLHLVNLLYDPVLMDVPLHDLTRLSGYHALFTLEPGGAVRGRPPPTCGWTPGAWNRPWLWWIASKPS